MKNRMSREDLIYILNGAGFEVDDDYSGRGMNGVTCPSIHLNELTTLMDLPNGVPKPTIDQLGKGYVAYWPNITK